MLEPLVLQPRHVGQHSGEKGRHILKGLCAYRAQWLPEKRCQFTSTE